jgi:hypothetical protein
MKNIYTNKGLGKISVKNFADSISYNGENLIKNSNFDQDNYYPYDGYDYNYYGNSGDGSIIMSKYWHNSPLRYDAGSYRTLFRKTFHIPKPPYDLLPYNYPLQKRFMKILPVGNFFPTVNTDLGLIRTISSVYSPAGGGGDTDLTSWVKYSAETIGYRNLSSAGGPFYQYPISVPEGVTTVNFGCSVRIAKNDQLRAKNFGGIFINFKKSTYRSYVNYIAICGNEVPTLLGDDNPYTMFNTDFNSNATSQWLGPNTTKVKVKKLSQTVQDNSYDSWKIINGSVTIPIFSTADNDATNGRAEYVSLSMYLAESFVYLNNNDNVDTGGMFFYNPYLYFS